MPAFHRIRLPVLSSALALLSACATTSSRSPVPVTFRVQADGLAETDTVFLVGNHAALGAWDPAAIPLERQADGRWARTIAFPPGTRLEFKFTRGAWTSEALGEGMRIQPNRRIEVSGPQTFEVRVPGWRDRDAAAPAVVGDLRAHEEIGGPGVPPRRVSVWLPPGYEAEAARRYPVLYMHDGQNCFDPARAAFGMEWRMDEEATRLIREGRIEPFIIAAMDCNGANRSAEYSDSPDGAAYRAYVVDVVKPLIDATYRTKPGAADTVVMGSSMGGCVSFLLAWDRPDVFSRAACLSPAFFKPELDRVRRYRGAPKPIRLYLDNGEVGLEKRLQKGCDRMLALLPSRGLMPGRDVEWHLERGAEHNEDAWAARVWRPLLFLFGGDAP
jgi:predicted alpha/beta superfamily hydrolase